VLARAAPAERWSCSLKRIPAAAIRAYARSLKPHPEFTLENATSLKQPRRDRKADDLALASGEEQVPRDAQAETRFDARAGIGARH